MYPWLMLAVCLACSCGRVAPRAGELSLAVAIGGSRQVQGHMRNVARIIDARFPYPYSEARLQSIKAVDLGSVRPHERWCLYLRQVMGHVNVSDSINPVPNLDQDDEVTGETAAEVEISSLTVKIDGTTLGWNRERSSELGGSIAASVDTDLFPASVSVSTTVYGHLRWNDGQKGDRTEQSQVHFKVRKKRICPPFYTCRVVTWTYTRTVAARCVLLPIFDPSCGTAPGDYPARIFLPGRGPQPLSGNISVALLSDLESITEQFYPL